MAEGSIPHPENPDDYVGLAPPKTAGVLLGSCQHG
jgi:hypothetical protein